MEPRERRVRWARVFGALASEPRLHIVELLAKESVPCQEILEELALSQPAVSYHLAKLEQAGVIRKERHGTRNCYRLEEAVRAWMSAVRKEEETWTIR